MNNFGISIFAGVAMLVGLSAHSQAGGFYEPAGSYKDYVSDAVAVPVPMPIPETTAWYVRGDVAYGSFEDADISEAGQYGLTSTNMEESWSVGGGFGYYFTPRLRGDITVEYIADTQVSGENLDTTAPVGGGRRTFDLHSTAALVNLYYDFNLHGRFSPYVGVGIGAAFNQTGAGRAIGTNPVIGTVGSIRGASEINFAWALMAGASYQIRTGLHIDANYRYLNLGSAQTGIIEDVTAIDAVHVVATNGGDSDIDDLTVHQVRVGFRQDIW